MLPKQGHVFIVGELLRLFAIGFVAAGNDEVGWVGLATHSFKQRPSTFDVGIKGGHGIAVGDAYLGLGG